MPAPALDAYRCLASKGAVRLRATRLTTGGAMIDGEDNVYVSDSLIQIVSTPQVITGQSYQQPNGAGVMCVDMKDPDTVSRAALSMDLCRLDAELLEFLTGATLITNGGVTVGMKEAPADETPPPVLVEAWSLAVEGSGQAEEDGDALYWHFVFPYTTWVPGVQTMAGGVMTVPLTGDTRGNTAIGLGPDNDWPVTIDTFRGFFLDDTLPDAACGATELILVGS